MELSAGASLLAEEGIHDAGAHPSCSPVMHKLNGQPEEPPNQEDSTDNKLQGQVRQVAGVLPAMRRTL